MFCHLLNNESQSPGIGRIRTEHSNQPVSGKRLRKLDKVKNRSIIQIKILFKMKGIIIASGCTTHSYTELFNINSDVFFIILFSGIKLTDRRTAVNTKMETNGRIVIFV